MLLVIDVGNTNITLGVFNGENLSATFRMTTKIQRTSDEYGIALNELIWHYAFSWKCHDQIFRNQANRSFRRNQDRAEDKD